MGPVEHHDVVWNGFNGCLPHQFEVRTWHADRVALADAGGEHNRPGPSIYQGFRSPDCAFAGTASTRDKPDDFSGSGFFKNYNPRQL